MPKIHVTKLFIFVGIVWAALVGPGSVVLILDSIGATNSQIGIVAGAFAVLSMVFQPIWGFVSDKIKSARKVLCFCLIGSASFFGAVFFFESFYIIVTLLLFDAIFRCGIVGLLDSHIIKRVNQTPGLQYGHIRLSGSVFFGFLSLVYSGIIDSFGVMTIIPVSFGIALFAVYWGFFVAKDKPKKGDALALPDQPVNDQTQDAKSTLKQDAIALFKNKKYIALIVFVGFSALSLQPLWMFLIVYVTEVGGTQGNVPLIHAIRCAVEIPLFIFIGTACKKVSAPKLMAIGVAFQIIYILGLLFASSFSGVLFAHLLGGAPGFVFGINGRLRFLNDITPNSVRATSITILGTIELGLGAIIGNYIAGNVLDIYSTNALSFISLGAQVAAAFMLLVIIFQLNKANRVRTCGQ